MVRCRFVVHADCRSTPWFLTYLSFSVYTVHWRALLRPQTRLPPLSQFPTQATLVHDIDMNIDKSEAKFAVFTRWRVSFKSVRLEIHNFSQFRFLFPLNNAKESCRRALPKNIYLYQGSSDMYAYLHIVWKLQALMPQSPPKVASVLCKFCRSLERYSGIEDIVANRDSSGEGPGEKIAFVLPFDLSICNFRGFIPEGTPGKSPSKHWYCEENRFAVPRSLINGSRVR